MGLQGRAKHLIGCWWHQVQATNSCSSQSPSIHVLQLAGAHSYLPESPDGFYCSQSSIPGQRLADTRWYSTPATRVHDAWRPGMKQLSEINNLVTLNDELAQACVKDRAMARQQLLGRMYQLPDASAEAPLSLDCLECLTVTEMRRMLRPCVADATLTEGDRPALAARLLAVLQYTSLRGAKPINLYDRESMDEVKEAYMKAWHAGQATIPQPDTSYTNPVRPPPPAPSSMQIAMERALRDRVTEAVEPQAIATDVVADLLVDARLEDVAIIDLTVVPDQRTADTLILASGRSSQHALAGASAAQYQIKEALKLAGKCEMDHPVTITSDDGNGWYSLNTGGVSIHCMTRNARNEFDLETLWGHADNIRWWRRDENPLTLDTIRSTERV